MMGEVLFKEQLPPSLTTATMKRSGAPLLFYLAESQKHILWREQNWCFLDRRAPGTIAGRIIMLKRGRLRKVYTSETKKFLSRPLFELCSQNFDSQIYSFWAREQKILFCGILNRPKKKKKTLKLLHRRLPKETKSTAIETAWCITL